MDPLTPIIPTQEDKAAFAEGEGPLRLDQGLRPMALMAFFLVLAAWLHPHRVHAAVPAFPASAPPAAADSVDMPLARQAALERMVAYWSSYLNTLGDASVPVLDKDVIIRQSYGKLFRDSAVQVEDDLDPARAVSIHKPVQAYLQDVEFFFRAADFEHEVLGIESQQTDAGSASWRIKTLRKLNAVDLRGDSINEVLTRYLEINETPDGLKIVSIYHSTPDRTRALRAWWASLSPDWRSSVSDGVLLTAELPLARVRSYRKGLLITSTDTFRLADAPRANAMVQRPANVPDSVILESSFQKLDSLPLRATDIDALLLGVQDRRSLDLSGKRFADWRPLEAFRRLEDLQLQGSNLADGGHLRGMVRLERLDLSSTQVTDLTPLRFAQNLEVLVARHSALRGPLPDFAHLRELDLRGCPLDSDWRPPSAPALESLNLAGSGVQGLGWPKLPRLKRLDLSHCGVADLAPLGPRPSVQLLKLTGNPLQDLAPLDAWTALRHLWIDSTGAATLRALSDLPQLERVDANASAVERTTVQALHRSRPQILVVYETQSLQDWWKALSPPWRRALSRAIGEDAAMAAAGAPVPSEAVLHRMTSTRTLDLRGSALCPAAAACAPNDSTGCLERSPVCLEPLQRLPELEALYLGAALLPPSSAERHWQALAELEQLQVLDLSGQHLPELGFLHRMAGLSRLYVDSAGDVDWDTLMALPRLEYLFADGAGIGDSLADLLQRRHPELVLSWQSASLDRMWQAMPALWREAIRQAVEEQTGSATPPLLQQGFHPSYPPSGSDYNRLHLWQRQRIQKLDLPAKGLEDLAQLVFLPYLRELYVPDNRLRSLLNLRHVPLLQRLDVSGNPLEGLSGIGACSDLRILNSANTPIGDLDPVAALTRLEELYVSGTDIRNLNPLEGLRALRVVHAANTDIRNLNGLETAPELVELSIFNTRVSDGKVARFREDRPQCRVTYY